MRPTGSTFYYFFFILFLFSSSYAQVFPVQGNLQITPPYSPYLSDYTAAGTQKITLQLRSNDIALSDHPIRLRFSIEGVGISIRTKPGYIPPAPHTLMGGGAPTLFYGEDLLDYFSPDNLDFAGFSRSDFQKSAKLPEGVYRFSFEVFDYYRQVPLSSKITMVTWIVLNDPPLLNLPLNQAKVSLIDPVNIAFTWTPRHTASPNAAFSTEYVFKLVEIWPANRNPYDAFLSQTPLYETTTTESQLIYGPAEPALITGRKYAWQVQARDENGRDIFKNQGKSEVFVFQFGDGPGIPENLHKQSGNTQTLTLLWEAPARGVPDQYNIRYKTTAENKWSETLSDQPWVTLTSLQPNTDYDVQVRSKREDLYSDYTAALRVKTDEKAREFTCGQPPPAPTKPDKTSRLLQLTPGDVFTCSDWRIVVIEVTRSANGEYAGKGMMAVKMFNGASVEVVFHGDINADYQLVTGGVESTYKKDSEMGSVVEEMHKIGEKKKDTTKTNIDSLPLPQLQELAQSLIDIPQKKIDNATVLNREEKQQINGARTKAKEALKTLNDPKATDKEKKEAEKNLRKAVAGAKPAMDKLTNSDKDKQVVADRWFKNIMDFLNGYKGNSDDEKRQAEMWHHRMDSTVEVLSKKTNVPDSLMNAMLVAHQNAKTAWLNLEKGSDGKKRKGPSNDFDDGFTAEDIVLCKKEVVAAKKVNEFIGEVLANRTVIKKCYYEIEGRKFHNGDTIFMSKSNKNYAVKGYREVTKPMDANSVWTGFATKKDATTYIYKPTAVSQDIKGSLLSTTFTRDSTYRITKKDKTIDSLVKVQDTLKCRVVVVEGNFSRCLETGDLRNVYGYDEMNINDKNDDHISVKSLGSTFVKLNCSLTGFKSLSFNADKSKIVVESTSDPSVFKITSKQTTEKEEVSVEVSTKSFRTDVFAKLVVCIYKEVAIENGKFYGIAQTGNLSSRPPLLISSLILEEAKKHLKHEVLNIEKISPMEYVDVNFDLNGNGVIDCYNDGNNPEIGVIRKKLAEIKADAKSIVLIKDKINDVWRIKNSVKKGDTTITLTSSSNFLDLSETFIISKPKGDSTEIFKIVSRKGQQIIIDTDETKVGNQGFMNNHPRINNNDLLSYCVKSRSHSVAGLAAKFPHTPALVVGVTEKVIGQLFAHELSHGFDLYDVDKIGNVMHYTVVIPSLDHPFTYQEQHTVVTGTATRTGEKQNQWNTVNRKLNLKK